MKHYLAGITIAGFVAFLIFRVADDQLGLTAKVNNMIAGRTV